MIRRLPTLPVLACLVAPLFAADVDRFGPDTKRRYDAVVPTAAELTWKKIPWTTDLREAVAAATEEKRPLFIWVSGDDPLNRC